MAILPQPGQGRKRKSGAGAILLSVDPDLLLALDIDGQVAERAEPLL
jgi:hypothetical protein